MSPAPVTVPPPTTASALDAIVDLLDLRRCSGPPSGRATLGLVSGRSGPRFLVPTSYPDAAPQACLAYLGLRDARTRLARGAVGWALRARATRLVIGDTYEVDAGPGSLIAHLEDLLRDDEHEPGLAVAVGLGRRDEVWKPTLQVFRPDGTPAAFVKVGLGAVADELVSTEARALAAWGAHPDPRLVVPGLLADTTWNGMRIAVVAPLPDDARRLPPGVPSAWAVRELDGPAEPQSLVEAAWWRSRRDACAHDARVDRLLDRIEDRQGAAVGSMARWHGDWVPWNLARCHRGLVAWDWEYSEPGAPVGLDEVHGAFQQAHVAEGRSIAAALDEARHAASSLVARSTSPTSPAELRARAGTEEAPSPFASARWLTDLHLAMLLSRAVRLEQLAERPPAHRAELLAAAEAAEVAEA